MQTFVVNMVLVFKARDQDMAFRRSPFLFAKDMQKGKLDEVCPSWKNQNAFIAVMRRLDDDDDDDDSSFCLGMFLFKFALQSVHEFLEVYIGMYGDIIEYSVLAMLPSTPSASQQESHVIGGMGDIQPARLLRGRRRASHWASLGKAFHVPNEAPNAER